MPRGAVLALAGLAALLAALLAAGGAQAVVTCSPVWDCTATIQPAELTSGDAWVDEQNPHHNYNTGSGSEVLEIRGGQGKRAWVLLKFPLDELPRNATITDARVVFRATTSDPGRTIRVFELLDPWNEATVNWTSAQTLRTDISPISNLTTQTGQNPFQTLFGSGAQVYANAFNEPPGSAGITHSFRKAYLAQQPYHGHLFKDDGGTTGDLPATQRFNGSSDLNAQDHRPALVVRFHPNAPDIKFLKADHQERVNASSTRAVNLSFEVFDPRGKVIHARINATTPQGQEVFNHSVFENRTSTFSDVFRHKVWRNASLGLPEGEYVLNAFALDDDGNLNYTLFNALGGINLTVENQPPWVNQSAVGATSLDEGQPLSASVVAEDRSGIAAVRLEVRRGGAVVGNVSFSPSLTDANMSGAWNLTTKAAWAGQLNLTIWVEDRAGNLNLSRVFPLHVRDTLPPVIGEARVLTPGRSPEGAALQEEGGRVAWEVVATDASPLTVVLELGLPSGASCPVAPAGGACAVPFVPGAKPGEWRLERNFTQRGSYAGTVVARDPDGNAASRSGLGFVLLEGAAPSVGALQPADGATGRARPDIRAEVEDLNLDPGSVTLELREAQGSFRPADARTITLGETRRRIEAAETFFHGEVVEARVRAADLLGRAASRTWTFTIDARAPATFVSTDGPVLAGERTILGGNTTLRFEREDQGSGVLATVLTVVHEDRALGQANTTVTGAQPFAVNLSASPVFAGTGNYSVFYSSTDHAGNVEEVQRRRYLVDDAPPRVAVQFEPGLLTATVDEQGSGLREVRAFYWLAPGGQRGEALMGPTQDPRVWRAAIPDVERGARVLYAVEARDQLGNVGRAGSQASPLSSIVQNHKPLVTIAPANGSLVKGTVTITWDATDKDGDALQTSLAVRPSTSTEARELAPLRGAHGEFPWDTRGVGDGLWVVEVTARDGFETMVARSFLEVSNTDSRIAALRAPGVEPGQVARVEATLYRPVERAEAVVSFGGQEQARVALRDDGQAPDRKAGDGVFTGQFVPARPGPYVVEVSVLFQDGRLETREQPLEAQWAFPARIVHEPLLLVLVVGVPSGAAGWWLWRRYGPIRVRR